MLSIGFEVQFTFFRLENYTRMVFTLFAWSSPRLQLPEVGLTEKINIALENVTVYTVILVTFMFESVLLFLVFVTQIPLKLVIL